MSEENSSASEVSENKSEKRRGPASEVSKSESIEKVSKKLVVET